MMTSGFWPFVLFQETEPKRVFPLPVSTLLRVQALLLWRPFFIYRQFFASFFFGARFIGRQSWSLLISSDGPAPRALFSTLIGAFIQG